MADGRGVLTRLALILGLGWSCGAAFGATDVDVVASIKPVHSLVAGVMQGVGEPFLLVQGAGSPHTYQLRPSEARALDGAGIVFWVGEDLEAFLAKPLQALSSDATIVALSEAPGIELLATRAGGTREEHAHAEHADDAHARGGGGAEHAPEHGQFDMHVWLDPQNAQAMVGAIVATLSAGDPGNTATYESNGARLRGELRELDQSVRDRLQPVRHRPSVVFHDAYHYLENRYGLNAVGSISVDPGRRPGARRLAEIRERLNELEAACVFAEPQFEPALVDTVIEGTSARKGVLDPLGADLDAGPEQYFQLISGLADSLIDCLGQAH